jgi:hypothetical protein
MEHLGAPFMWSIVAVLGIAVAAAMIAYGIYAIRKKDEPDPLYGGVSGTLKEDWARTGNIDFHVGALESASLNTSSSVSRNERSWKIQWDRR